MHVDSKPDILARLGDMARPQLGPPSDEAETKWPELYRLLTSRVVNGKTREPGRLTVIAAPGCWRVTYTDADLGVMASVDVPALAEVWQCLQDALTSRYPCQWSELRRGKAAAARRRALEEEAQRRKNREQ
jgi:hypothetical protein